MATKNTGLGRKPIKKADELDAFVTGAKTVSENDGEKVPKKRLTVEIPAEWHHKLKVKCATEGTNFNTVVKGFVEQYLR